LGALGRPKGGSGYFLASGYLTYPS